MSLGIRIIIDLFLVLGCFFAFAGVVGMLRMPDVFCRMQASTIIPTMGVICVCVAGVIGAVCTGMAVSIIVKLVILGVFVVLTNPISGHALCKAAYKAGNRPEKPMICDDYGEDEKDE